MNIKNLYKKWKWKIQSISYRQSIINDWYKEKIRVEQLENILKRQFTKEELRRAEHFRGIENKNRKLREVVRQMQLKAEKFNRLLYATKLIVRCTGCIAGAPKDYKNLTEEKVQEVEKIAERLRAWWECNKNRINKV